MNARPVFLLSKHTGWYGSHSGYYEQIARRWSEQPHVQVIPSARRRWWRLMTGCWQNRRLQTPTADPMQTYQEWCFRRTLNARTGSRGVVLNMDDRVNLWGRMALPGHVVGVIHLPPSEWTESQYRVFRRLSSAVTLWRSVIPTLESMIGPHRVRFVPHGVDTNFFQPSSIPRDSNHLLCCGQYLRDYTALRNAYAALKSQAPQLRLTVIVPRFKLNSPELAWCAQTPGVSLRSSLSDQDYLTLLQSCTLLLMPLKNSGANNTVLEALACGLPIVTNDVGGIRDYGGGTTFPLATDPETKLIDLAAAYLTNPERRAEVSIQQRKLALGFDWAHCIAQLAETVDELTAQASPTGSGDHDPLLS